MKNQIKTNQIILFVSLAAQTILAILTHLDGAFMYQIQLLVVLGIYLICLLFYWAAIELFKRNKTIVGWIFMGLFILVNIYLITESIINLNTYTRVPWG